MSIAGADRVGQTARREIPIRARPGRATPVRWRRANAGPTLRPIAPDRRGRPLPDVQGEPLVRERLAEIDEEERLSAAIGIDLAPPAPSPPRPTGRSASGSSARWRSR